MKSSLCMRGFRWSISVLVVFLSGVLSAANATAAVGYVYTINNDVDHNGVVVLEQMADGSLKEMKGSPFATSGKGLAGGDIDEQGAIRVHGDFVLAVNPGSDTIAVLHREADGSLRPVEGSPFPSGGNTPLSLDVHDDLVYVANQAASFANPTRKPNVTGFRLMNDGKLVAIPNSTWTFPEGAGPAQIEFSPTGKTVVVTSGFQKAETSRIHSALVMDDGRLKPGPGSPARTQDVSGVVGYSWNKAGDRVYVSNFRGSAITMFDVNQENGAIKQVGGALNDGQTAACWTAISPDGKTLYVANFVSNSISALEVMDDGGLKLLSSTTRRGATSPDTKDIEVSKDGKFLYAIGSGARQISIFRIGAEGMLTELPEGQSPLTLTTGQNTTGLATH